MATLPCRTAVTWLGRLALACVPVPLAPIRLQHWLATPHQQRHNAPVPFNSGTGRRNPNITLADTAARAVFLCSFVLLRLQWWAGRGSFRAGRFQCADIPTPVRSATHRRKWVAENKPHIGGHDMSKLRHALSRLLPVFSVPVSTVPTHAQACAMARLLVSQGKRVAIAPAAQGFTVSEVKA